MSTTVYGASDDLIEIDGAISEEFLAYEYGDVLGFSTGVVLSIKYDDDGYWRIRPLVGASRVTITTDLDNYTDRAELHEPPAWVVCGAWFAKAWFAKAKS